jgi:hypothetical protein
MMMFIPRAGRGLDLRQLLGVETVGPSVSPDEAFAQAKQAFDDLRAKVNGFVHSNNARQIEALRLEYENAFHDRSASLGIEPDRIVQRYLDSATAFAQHVYRLASINESVFQSELWRETMQLLTPWQVAEENYSRLGLRTVSFADWFRSCKSPFVMKTVPQPVYHLLLVKRDVAEQPVMHASHQNIGDALQKVGKELVAE